MRNRKLPFGYRMEQGKPVIEPTEAEIVMTIFEQYTAGASYLDLLRALKVQPIPYDTGRLWNKNMVARILENERYTGKQGYPMIIGEELLWQATQRRKAKQTTVQPTETQRVLRRLSGQKVSPEMEGQILALLNGLVEAPETIQQPAVDVALKSTEKLESELGAILETQPIDEENAKQLILQIAAARYESVSSEEYETQRLRRIFAKAEKMEELNAELLRNTVSEIKISSKAITIRMKNNQTIERRSTP